MRSSSNNNSSNNSNNNNYTNSNSSNHHHNNNHGHPLSSSREFGLNSNIKSASPRVSLDTNAHIIMETPESKAMYKEFYRKFRSAEKEAGVQGAKQLAVGALISAPPDAKWRILLELADLSKRHNQMDEVSEAVRRVSRRGFACESCASSSCLMKLRPLTSQAS